MNFKEVIAITNRIWDHNLSKAEKNRYVDGFKDGCDESNRACEGSKPLDSFHYAKTEEICEAVDRVDGEEVDGNEVTI